jgi:hypothetical protein
MQTYSPWALLKSNPHETKSKMGIQFCPLNGIQLPDAMARSCSKK